MGSDAVALSDAGLPREAMGVDLRRLRFRAATVGTGLNAHVRSAEQQHKALVAMLDAASDGLTSIAGTVLFFAEGVDTNAMQAAGAVFEAIFQTHNCACLAAEDIRAIHNGDAEERRELRSKDVYLIYGISDQMRDVDAQAVRNFVRRRDGSLFLLVASAPVGGLHDLLTVKLRMHIPKIAALCSDAYDYELGDAT